VTFLRLAGLLSFCLVVAVLAPLPESSRAESTSFTLVGRADGGAPSGRRLVIGETLVIVSDDSGAPVRYTIDLRWVRDKLPAIDQDDQLEVEIQVLSDGTWVATNIVNVSDRTGTFNQGQSTGSLQVPQEPRSNDRNNEDQQPPNIAPTATLTPTLTPTSTLTLTPTATGTVSPTATGIPLAAPVATVTPTQIATPADLALSKVVNNATPNVGDTVTFTVTLANNGPNPATNVQVTDQLPAGLTFVSASLSQGTYTAGSGVWDVGTMTMTTAQTLQIQATVVSPNSLTNVATVSDSDQFDPDPGNNTVSATETPQQADLMVTKSVNNPTPNVGQNVTFTVTLINSGPDLATTVRVTDQLPAGLTFVSAMPSQGTYDSATGVWDVGTVSVGTARTLTIQATVMSAGASTNTATVSDSDQFDPNPGNNSAGATETPQQADLMVTKSVNNPTPSIGQIVTFTVTLTNNGPNTATTVRVTDVLPAGLTFVSAMPSQGTYDSATGNWEVGTVSVGAAQTLQIRATVMSAGAFTNTATVSHSDQFDPDTGNNSRSATVTA
jgi:uncharacterized repeat protein (TIGR01451 family)